MTDFDTSFYPFFDDDDNYLNFRKASSVLYIAGIVESRILLAHSISDNEVLEVASKQLAVS
jgi:hypothetical protein